MSEVGLARRSGSVATQLMFVLFCAGVLAFVAATMPAGFSAAFLIVLLFGMVFLRRPELGLLVTLLVRSSTDLSFRFAAGVSVAGVTLGALPNILMLAVVVLVGVIVILSRKIPFIGLPGGKAFSLLLLSGLAATVNAETKLLAISDWLPVASSFVVYALAAYLFNTLEGLQKVVDAMCLSFLVPASLGLYQMVQREGVIVPGLGWPRIFGTFVHPNAFGFYLVVILALFVTRLLTEEGIRRGVALAGTIVATVLLLGTFSRIVWVGAAVVMIIVGLLRYRPLLVVLPVAVVLLLGLVAPVAQRLADPLGGSFADRFAVLWPATLFEWSQTTASEGGSLIILVKRLVGLGPGMGLVLSERGYGLSTPPHNDYLRALVEYGVIGLVVFVVLLVIMWVFGYRTWRAAAAYQRASGISLAFFALSTAFPIMSLTDNVFGYTANQIYFWTLAGLTVAVNRIISGSLVADFAST